MPPTRSDFEAKLRSWLASATEGKRPFVEISSGDLHRRVGGYPGSDHRMPVCCQVLRDEMRPGTDVIVSEPPSGQGATLVVRFALPR